MYVKIGKYPDRLICRIYSNYMNKKYGICDWPNKQSKFENLIEKIEDSIQAIYNIFNDIYFDKNKRY